MSGHYLVYRVKYDAPDPCSGASGRALPEGEALHYCPAPPFFAQPYEGKSCALPMVGWCENGRFTAGIERFYIPEEHAPALDQAVRNHQGALVVSFQGKGQAVVQDLRIEGQSWRTWLGGKK
ncbi:MAG: GDYXXLXY domain-containing protein [Magnetococcales bacterium]|nr:GDYXXLXY domain-containing protein [Magnetococcales bacterium]